MSGWNFKPLLVMLLIGHVGHFPLPCYDADGENRGTLTQGLTDPSAWHVFLLGVTPESDIDRGPLSSDQHDQLYVSAFGPAAVVNAKVVTPALDEQNGINLLIGSLLNQAVGAATLCVEDSVPRTYGCSYLAHSAQDWRNRLCLMLN